MVSVDVPDPPVMTVGLVLAVIPAAGSTVRVTSPMKPFCGLTFRVTLYEVLASRPWSIVLLAVMVKSGCGTVTRTSVQVTRDPLAAVTLNM